MGWLVDDEVSACTHRGFCLPWRVKPRLSERAPPHQALDPLCSTALPRHGPMDQTWLEDLSPGLKTEQALLAAAFSPLLPSHPQLLLCPPTYPPPALTLGRGWWWAGWSLEGVGSLGGENGGLRLLSFPKPPGNQRPSIIQH